MALVSPPPFCQGQGKPESEVSHRCSALQCIAVCCSVLQCVAVCCSVLQCVAVSCNDKRTFILGNSYKSRYKRCGDIKSALQCTAVCCSVLQCVAVCCNDTGTADPTWGDDFESCFKAQSSKLKRLFCHVSVQRDVRALSFEL
jgi:hypothetical protein